ncbi:hypothetical protein ACFY64_09940 [Streptomyces collinus]|uniref:hypothetical protein n=1 Tax=Streptomyces collinus TaxID=42684 RepID=UPI0036AAFF0F
MIISPDPPGPDRRSGGPAQEAGASGGTARQGGARASGCPARSARPGRRVLSWVATGIAVAGLCGATLGLPEVRDVLRDSFTERQHAYIELYFGEEPFFDGNELVVPLSVVEHGDSGGRRTVRARAQDTEGRRLATRATTVTTKPGARIDIDVRLTLKGGGKRDAELVEVTLPGHPQRLRTHLR